MSKLKDVETSATIKLALIANPHIGGLDINVETVNGIVFLQGYVQDRIQKNLAEDIARQRGGIDIKNDIQVLSEIEDSTALLGVQSDDIGDHIICDHVRGDLQSDNRVNPSTINVDCGSGVVRLTGVQDMDAAKNRAEQIAWRVDGVQEVINDIEVREDIAMRDRAA